MRREGEEVHESTEEARAGSTPNIVRWVLAISLLAAILALSAIWIFGALSTEEEDRTAKVTERFESPPDEGDRTDSIVSDRSEFEFGGPDPADAASADDRGTTPEPAPPQE